MAGDTSCLAGRAAASRLGTRELVSGCEVICRLINQELMPASFLSSSGPATEV